MIKGEIGVQAGVIWQYLDKNGECPVDDLKKNLHLEEKDFYLALGWLARENKVVFYTREDTEYVFLHY